MSTRPLVLLVVITLLASGCGIGNQPSPSAGLAPIPTPVAECITFAAYVLFDEQQATLKPDGRESLARMARIVVTRDVEVILAEGHADPVEAPAYAQLLSEQRAEAVKDFLVSNGVGASIVFTSGHGSGQPLRPNRIDGHDNPEGRAKNRRVEVEVVERRKPLPPLPPGQIRPTC